MSGRPGLTKVAAGGQLPQAALRTMALDIKAISTGRGKPQPELVTPPEASMVEQGASLEPGGEKKSRAGWIKTIVLILLLVAMGIGFYFYGWGPLSTALGLRS